MGKTLQQLITNLAIDLTGKAGVSCWIFLHIVCLALGQTQPEIRQKIHQLDSIYTYATNDSIRIEALLEKVSVYAYINSDSALIFCRKAEQESVNKRYLEGRSAAIEWQGFIWRLKGEPRKAIYYYQKSLALDWKKGDKEAMAGTYNNLGAAYYDIQKIEKALECYLQSLLLYDAVEDDIRSLNSLYNIAVIFESYEEYPKALGLLNMCIRLAEQKDYAQLKAYALTAKGKILNNLAPKLPAIQQKPREFIFTLHNEALQLFKQLGDKKGEAQALMNIGMYYQDMVAREQTDFNKIRLLDSAMAYYQASNTVNHEFGFVQGMAISLHKMGQIYAAQNKNAAAITSAKEGYTYAKQLGYPVEIRNVTELLYTLYANEKNYAEAFSYLHEYMIMRDSANALAVERESVKKELQFALEKKKEENNRLRQSVVNTQQKVYVREWIVLGLICILILLSIGGYLFFKQQQIIARQNQNILKQKLLLSQLNPHFIFNALNAIQNFVYKNDIRQSGAYLAQFAELMRMILDNSRLEAVSLEKEILFLNNYVALQQLRFNHTFQFDLYVDPQLDVAHIVIPPMLTQPFVENAIEHGLRHKANDGLLSIRIEQIHEELIMQVHDNGGGFKPTQTGEKKHISHATQITKERIAALNKQHNWKLAFDIQERPSEGVLVIFKIQNPQGNWV